MFLTIMFFTAGALSPLYMEKDFSKLHEREQDRIKQLENKHETNLRKKKKELEKKLLEINPQVLRIQAREAYRAEFKARKNFEQRFALSKREKSQLRMQNLSQQATLSLQDRIRLVAREASPIGASVQLSNDSRGMVLMVDFDMGSMSAGEGTPRTRHQSIESLKTEVRSLVARAASDILMFCRDFPLERIELGCMRQVWVESFNNHQVEESMLLYKVNIQKNTNMDLSSNPFLNQYETERHLQVLEDNFDSVQVIKKKSDYK